LGAEHFAREAAALELTAPPNVSEQTAMDQQQKGENSSSSSPDDTRRTAAGTMEWQDEERGGAAAAVGVGVAVGAAVASPAATTSSSSRRATTSDASASGDSRNNNGGGGGGGGGGENLDDIKQRIQSRYERLASSSSSTPGATAVSSTSEAGRAAAAATSDKERIHQRSTQQSSISSTTTTTTSIAPQVMSEKERIQHRSATARMTAAAAMMSSSRPSSSKKEGGGGGGNGKGAEPKTSMAGRLGESISGNSLSSQASSSQRRPTSVQSVAMTRNELGAFRVAGIDGGTARDSEDEEDLSEDVLSSEDATETSAGLQDSFSTFATRGDQLQPHQQQPALLPVANLVAAGGDTGSSDDGMGSRLYDDSGFSSSMSPNRRDLPTASKYEPDAASTARSLASQKSVGRFRTFTVLAAFVILAAIAVGVAVGVTSADKKNGGAQDGSAPTDAPTTYRESLGIANFIEQVVRRDAFKDPDSPYSKALEWITNEDPMQLVPGDTAPNFIQRYAAAYLYFATTVDGPWKSCNPPMKIDGDEGYPSDTFCLWSRLRDTDVDYYYYKPQPATAWLSNATTCSWAGVSCDEEGQIIRLDLGGQGLSGTFPEGIIYMLPFLSRFAFTLGSLRGPLPGEMSKMIHLKRVVLGRNSFTGTIPEGWWSSSWDQLVLSGNKITGSLSTKIGQLRDLKFFLVANNSLSEKLPSEIGLLNSIARFDVSGNDITGEIPSEIGSWRSALVLRLHTNRLQGQIPDSIGKISSLRELELHTNPGLSGALPEPLFDLTQLNRLDIGNCDLSGTLSNDIGKLSVLYFLFISDNKFSGLLPTAFAQLTNLHQVQLQGTGLLGTVPDEVCAVARSDDPEFLVSFIADCAPGVDGDIELTCSCCNICCEPDGGECLPTQ